MYTAVCKIVFTHTLIFLFVLILAFLLLYTRMMMLTTGSTTTIATAKMTTREVIAASSELKFNGIPVVESSNVEVVESSDGVAVVEVSKVEPSDGVVAVVEFSKVGVAVVKSKMIDAVFVIRLVL